MFIRIMIVVAIVFLVAHIVCSKDIKTKSIRVTATGYCPCRICCERFADGKTSQGRSAYTHGIAADPKAIPYGTKLHVPGYDHPDLKGRYTVVDDTGGAMRQSWKKGRYHIDVRFKTHKEALQWGVKKLVVTLLE